MYDINYPKNPLPALGCVYLACDDIEQSRLGLALIYSKD
jgi:hypothetical protein